MDENSNSVRAISRPEELERLQKMYHQAKRDQLGITLGLLDIWTEVQKLYRDQGEQVPIEVMEFFQP